jgi:hypothetical protein
MALSLDVSTEQTSGLNNLEPTREWNFETRAASPAWNSGTRPATWTLGHDRLPIQVLNPTTTMQ